jgi:hemoglobin
MTGSLYERLGGAYGIAAAADTLIDSLHENQTLNLVNDKVKDFHAEKFKAGYKFMITAWVIEMTGGPKCYPGRDMLESHAHLGLSDYEFDVTAHDIRNTLYRLGTPRREIEEVMEIVLAQRDKVVAHARAE